MAPASDSAPGGDVASRGAGHVGQGEAAPAAERGKLELNEADARAREWARYQLRPMTPALLDCVAAERKTQAKLGPKNDAALFQSGRSLLPGSEPMGDSDWAP